MTKYQIIKDKDYAAFTYNGKYADLKIVLDDMAIGDCILVDTDDEKKAALAHGRSVAFRGHKVMTRVDSVTGGFFVWKLKDDRPLD